MSAKRVCVCQYTIFSKQQEMQGRAKNTSLASRAAVNHMGNTLYVIANICPIIHEIPRDEVMFFI